MSNLGPEELWVKEKEYYKVEPNKEDLQKPNSKNPLLYILLTPPLIKKTLNQVPKKTMMNPMLLLFLSLLLLPLFLLPVFLYYLVVYIKNKNKITKELRNNLNL